jgi:hypothetical protein
VQTLLTILDWLVKLTVVATLARALWTGSTRSGLLSSVLTIGFLLFGMVSLSASAGLASGSGFNQGALLIFLAVIAIVASRSWVNKPAQ